MSFESISIYTNFYFQNDNLLTLDEGSYSQDNTKNFTEETLIKKIPQKTIMENQSLPKEVPELREPRPRSLSEKSNESSSCIPATSSDGSFANTTSEKSTEVPGTLVIAEEFERSVEVPGTLVIAEESERSVEVPGTLVIAEESERSIEVPATLVLAEESERSVKVPETLVLAEESDRSVEVPGTLVLAEESERSVDFPGTLVQAEESDRSVNFPGTLVLEEESESSMFITELVKSPDSEVSSSSGKSPRWK